MRVRSVLFRSNESLLRLNCCNIGGTLERRRLWFARLARTADRTKPVFQARRRDEPEEPHRLTAGVRHFVQKPAADHDHGFRAHVVALVLDLGIAAAAIAEEELVAALMAVPSDMRAWLQQLQAGG